MRADADAALGMVANTGSKKIARKNITAVTRAVRPVLPPAATPAPDSTKVVTVEVPRIAPVQVAMESEYIIWS